MKIVVSHIELWFRRLLPSPFSIAIILTVITFLLTLTFGDFEGDESSIILACKSWKNGLWSASLMRFLVQMMLMLVLGHILALSRPVELTINWLLNKIHNGNQAIVYS